jgi:hypothetical protein
VNQAHLFIHFGQLVFEQLPMKDIHQNANQFDERDEPAYSREGLPEGQSGVATEG